MEIGSEDTVLATATADDYYYNDLITAKQLPFVCFIIVFFLSLQLDIRRFTLTEPTIFDIM